MKTFLLGTACALLVACAQWQTGPEAPWRTWTCHEPASIRWRYLDANRERLQLRLGEQGTVWVLSREPATTGAYYAGSGVAFHMKNRDSLVYRLQDGQVLARGCNASLISF